MNPDTGQIYRIPEDVPSEEVARERGLVPVSERVAAAVTIGVKALDRQKLRADRKRERQNRKKGRASR